MVIRHTAGRGHAQDLAYQGARAGHPLIVAVGGDGTFSEVVNGVLTASEPFADSGGCANHAAGPTGPAVGLINMGTGGDFRRSLGIGPGFERSLEALTRGQERTVDVGHASFAGRDGREVNRYFVNVLSAGLGGRVDYYVDTIPAFLGGRVGYYVASLRAVMTSTEQRLLARVTWETRTREEVIAAYVVAICNGRWFGGGMDVAPMALPDDGRFEVVTITAPSKPYLARRVRGVYKGRHLREPTVHHFPCHRLELRIEDTAAERAFLLDIDGEALGSLPLRVEIIPRRLRVRA